MNYSGIQKAIPLMVLIAIGYALQRKFKQPAAIGAIKTFIINAVLPAALFLSITTIDTQYNVFFLPAFALSINLYLLAVSIILARLIIPRLEKHKARTLILMFPSLAPALTAYPFIEEFLGKQGLAWAALADVGNKMFVLLGLYTLALHWQQQMAGGAKMNRTQFKTIGLNLITEPANVAVILGLLWVGLKLNTTDLPPPLLDILQRLSACTTPLILFFIGVSFQLKVSQLKEILLILLARSASGFWFSAGAICLWHPSFPEEAMLAVILPQGGCSLWPLLYASQMNALEILKPGKKNLRRTPTFDTEFGLGLLTASIPVSICVSLTIFSSGSFFINPLHLGLVGSLLFAAGVFLKWGLFPLQRVISLLNAQMAKKADRTSL